MHLALATLSGLVLAQPAKAPDSTPSDQARLTRVLPMTAMAQPENPPTSPGELVAEALTPKGADLAGRPLALVEALASAHGAEQQLDVTHAYWRATAALARHHVDLRQHERIQQIDARPEDAPMLASARTSAAARLRIAESAALAARRELAQVALLRQTEPLPLPADLPHTGTYRTYFDEVFSARNPPARARLIDRKLPVRCKLIEARASAALAAREALAAAIDAYRLGTTDLATLLWALETSVGQERALLESVCDYNHDIADYALAVAGPQTDGRVVVAMLIKPSRGAARPLVSPDDRGRQSSPSMRHAPLRPSEVRPATLNAPASRSGDREPTFAPPEGRLRPVGPRGPRLAPPRESTEPPVEREPFSAAPSGRVEGPDGERSSPVAPAGQDEAAEPGVLRQPMVPVADEPSTPVARTVKKPVIPSQHMLPSAPGLYPALLELDAAAQAGHLTAALHRNTMLPAGSSAMKELKPCLTGRSGAGRRPVIAAYWLAAQRAAEYQALATRADFLEQLVPAALEHRDNPRGTDEMLWLQASQLAAQADVLAAELDLLDAQFLMTQRVGQPLDSAWLLPASVPYSGPYPPRSDILSARLDGSWPLARWAAVIPALNRSLQDRGAAVVEADAARAAATAAYQDGTLPIHHVLASIQSQTDETLAFLDAVARYNLAIADYTLTALPPAVPGEQLAEALIGSP